MLWTEGTGIPPDAYEPVSKIYTKIVSLAHEFKLGRMPREDEVADWQGMEWELYLENLPRSVEASQVVVLIFLVSELFYFSLSTLFFFLIYLFFYSSPLNIIILLSNTLWSTITGSFYGCL